MEPECLLSRSQESATWPYSEPGQSSPWLPKGILKIYFDIILPCTLLSSKWRLFPRLPDQTLKHLSSPHTCSDAAPISFSWSAHLSNIWRAVQKMQLLSSRTVTSSLLGPNIFLSTLFSKILSIYFYLTVKTNFHTHTKQRPTQSSVHLNLLILFY